MAGLITLLVTGLDCLTEVERVDGALAVIEVFVDGLFDTGLALLTVILRLLLRTEIELRVAGLLLITLEDLLPVVRPAPLETRGFAIDLLEDFILLELLLELLLTLRTGFDREGTAALRVVLPALEGR